MRNHWYIAATTRELKDRPLERRVLGSGLALFRDGSGRAVALADRCPHRNVKLSGGCVKDGHLMCPYHGWEFDAEGRCVHIPSLMAGEAIPSNAVTPTHPVREQQGYVWVWMGDEAPGDRAPFSLPHHGEAGWAHARMEATIGNAVENVIENFIDCSHTGYIHGGLFRTPASHRAATRVRQVEDGVVIDIDEEQETKSLLGRLLVGSHRVVHQDRFILPSIVQVSYRFGPRRQIIGYQLCTPVDEFETRVYVYVTGRLGVLTPLLPPLAPLVGRVVLTQDLAVLESQAEVLKRGGARFTSVPADTANLWIQACRARAARGEGPGPEREKEVEFRL